MCFPPFTKFGEMLRNIKLVVSEFGSCTHLASKLLKHKQVAEWDFYLLKKKGGKIDNDDNGAKSLVSKLLQHVLRTKLSKILI